MSYVRKIQRPPSPPLLVSRREAAEMLGVCSVTIMRYEKRGTFKRVLLKNVSRKSTAMYRRSDILAMIKAGATPEEEVAS